MNAAIERAARLVEAADSLILTAGAGMGVDSGLPDFRGPEGFWRAYPALRGARLRFEEIASPHYFHADPALAWGFYGHRLNLYRATMPHAGFRRLLEIGSAKSRGYFVFTSNVDGQFQKAGFASEQLIECHGSIHHLQCLENCRAAIWPADGFNPAVDEARCRLTSAPPRCSDCGAIARPNILMFGDWGWNEARTAAQEARYRDWRAEAGSPVVIELGAGTAIPSVRMFGERQGTPLIRINPADAPGERGRVISIPLGALDATNALWEALGR